MNNLDSLQRYGCCSVEAEPMYEDEEGEWVKFADVKKLLLPVPQQELKQCAGGNGWNDCHHSAVPGSKYCAGHSQPRRRPWSN